MFGNKLIQHWISFEIRSCLREGDKYSIIVVALVTVVALVIVVAAVATVAAATAVAASIALFVTAFLTLTAVGVIVWKINLEDAINSDL